MEVVKKNWGKVPTVDGWVRIVPNFYKSLFYDIFYKKKFKLFWQIHVKSPKSMILRGVLVPNLCGGWGVHKFGTFSKIKPFFTASHLHSSVQPVSVFQCMTMFGNQGMCVTHSH